MRSIVLALGLGLSLTTALTPRAVAHPPPGENYLLLRDGRIVKGPEMAQKECFVEVTFQAGTVQVPDALVGGLLLADQELQFQPKTDEERAQFEKGFVKVDGRWERVRNLRKDA